jgi:hypothetical protein
MAGAPRQQADGLASALGIHLCIYCAVAGCFALGLYALLQPSRVPNPGIAAYKPPPATVIAYVPQPFRRDGVATSAPPIAPAALTAPEPETTGRATETTAAPASRAISEPQIAAPSVPHRSKPKPRREARKETSPPQRSACLPGYDSSGAQTRSC